MRFVRYGESGAEKPGTFDADGRLRDLSDQIANLSGTVLGDLASLRADGPLVAGAPRLGPPVSGIGKIVCIGKNYAEHAAETGSAPPPEPMIFMKATSALAGPNDTIVIPRGSKATDYEVELAIVIGKPARHVTEDDALSYVAGYSIMNDLSERDWQWHRAGQYTKGKSCDGFAPLGPWLVTPDELGEPQALRLTFSVNGALRQNGRTSDMIFGVRHLISYLSGFFTLHPGDVIATGTPAGVGAGLDPPQFLAPGDWVEAAITGLGQQSMDVIAEP
ncbi:MAG: fumarylacetoacetate hydrolase family protein [Pseudomonadota bacterium]